MSWASPSLCMLVFHSVGLCSLSLRRLQPLPPKRFLRSRWSLLLSKRSFLGWRSPFPSTLIEMPHAAHPLVSVFFNFAFLPNDVNVDSVSSFTVFNLIPDRDGASCALFDSFDCCTTPSSTKLCQITLIAYRVHRCLFPGWLRLCHDARRVQLVYQQLLQGCDEDCHVAVDWQRVHQCYELLCF